ncbi:hypothetical protein [Pseudovibrio brasiliensis]|uniref:Uncharacterized protein n=1 Tax=Pseudovibrio brasiliensis TaxID=1898042 RepID=A0ABX8ASR1_9HYPH|nr:hypothetical protein [Pseudovibrio brasiliensis]QUS57735.1 hypothetical protein KGB56_10250 [Pseudovibrio brasiliensis]
MTNIFIIVGALFGIIVVPLGFFVGLQVSPGLANILLLPFIVVSWSSGIPLGDMSVLLLVWSTVLSVAFWAAVFGLIGFGIKKLRS